jgi:thiamine-monophosphate kinase
MVEGVHFRRSWLTPRELGVRAWRAAVSDIAAMGATPLWVLLSLELPRGRGARTRDDALLLTRALSREARRAGATLVGGNVSGGPALAVTVTIVGETTWKPRLRSGAKPGHLVFVTGSFGGAAAGCRALQRRTTGSASSAVRAWRRPPLRIDFASEASRLGLVSAMIDVSDGLVQDLGYVAQQSQVAIRIDESAVPIHRAAKSAAAPLDLALAGGEDYELAFTAPRVRRATIEKLAAKHRVPITVVGVVERGAPAVTDSNGKRSGPARAGFDHFRTPGRRA